MENYGFEKYMKAIKFVKETKAEKPKVERATE